MPTAKAYIDYIYQEITSSVSTRLGQDSVNMLNTVSESIFSRSAHFILELLQNAEDAGPKDSPANGELEFSISPDRIRIRHNGLAFTEANVDALCGVRSTKKPEEGTLGFLGIGFKSVFKITDCPQVYSGDFHFKFDKLAHSEPNRVPWQIMPIWVETPPEPIEASLSTFILPFRSSNLYKQTLDELKKLDVHVFLFLKWLQRLRIVDEASQKTISIDNLGDSDGIITLKNNDAKRRFVIFRRTAGVPREIAEDPVLTFYKRQNATQREIVLAFAVDDAGDIQTIEEASALGTVSSFLPLVEERSGAKFLIQADFLVQPGREAIQYEIAWNQWLLGEAVELAKEAIEKFKSHPKWGEQFLPLFSFKSYNGQAAFDKLFGPKLKTPILTYLQTAEVFPTAEGGHVKAACAVLLESGLRGLLTDADLKILFGGRDDYRLAHPSIDEKTIPSEIAQNLKRLFFDYVTRHRQFLRNKISQKSGADWFLKFYEAMAETGRIFKEIQQRDKRGRFVSVDSPVFVLTESDEIVLATAAHLRKVPEKVQELREKFDEVDRLLQSYKFIHPCLDLSELTQFFTAKTHLQAIDYDRICREVFLAKVRVDVSAPSRGELITFTRLLQKGPRIYDSTIWVLTKQGAVKPSNQVFMGTAFSPTEDWEKHAKYSPQIEFLSSEYLQGATNEDIAGWKSFFSSVRVKSQGESNHVELFAMSFVEDQLSTELESFLPRDNQQVGYDREARRRLDGALVKIEIKGLKKDSPVELVGNEPTAAQAAANNREPYWVCIVSGIPENPQLWIVENVLEAGRSNTITIDISQWRTYGRRIG